MDIDIDPELSLHTSSKQFGRWLPPPASAEKYCSTSASVFVPTTFLVPFLFKQEKSLLAFALRNIDALTDKWTTRTSKGRRNKSESQIFVFVFLRFTETNLFSKLSLLFFSSALLRLRVRPSVRPYRSCAPSVRPSVRTGEICGKERIGANGRSPSFPKIYLSSALLRWRTHPSVLPSLRTSSPPVPPSERKSARFCGNERIRAKGRSPLFFHEGCLGRQLRWRNLNPKP